MCIVASVGRGGVNARDDVRTVQLLLNANGPLVGGPLVTDGVCGGGTVKAIEHFQRGVMGDTDAPGLVTPEPDAAAATVKTPGTVIAKTAGSTLRALRNGLPPGFTAEKLQGVCIHAAGPVVGRYFAAMVSGMETAKINTSLRQAHFLAQLAHESGDFLYAEEMASGAAYEGRKDLGNVQKGDGVRFKGRGLIQLTGRANYLKFGTSLGRDFCTGDACCQVATDPQLAVGAATWFWTTHGLNALADADDVVAITRRINGGLNGLDERKAKLARAKWFLAAEGNVVKVMQALGLR